MEYVGFEIRQSQIDENQEVIKSLGLKNVHYHLADGRFLEPEIGQFDMAMTCPPYYDLEVYSDQPDDISSFKSYSEFNASMWMCAHAGFIYHQQIVLSKNFGSATIRSTNSWKGKKLIPQHEFLLVFRTPDEPYIVDQDS